VGSNVFGAAGAGDGDEDPHQEEKKFDIVAYSGGVRS